MIFIFNYYRVESGRFFPGTTLKFKRSKAGSPDILNFFFLIFDSFPEGLNLGEEHDHESHMFVNSFVKGSLVTKSQSDILNLYLEVFVFIC